MRKVLIAAVALVALYVGGVEAWMKLIQYPAVASRTNEEAAEVMRLYRFAQRELSYLLPPTKIRFMDWIQVNEFMSSDGEIVRQEYRFSYERRRLLRIVDEMRESDPKAYFSSSWASGIYDPQKRTVFLNVRDGPNLRKAAHELIHVAIDSALEGVEVTESVHIRVEAYAEALGTISLANAYLGQSHLDREHISEYFAALREERPIGNGFLAALAGRGMVDLSGEKFFLQTDEKSFREAAKIALRQVSLRERVMDARRALSDSTPNPRN